MNNLNKLVKNYLISNWNELTLKYESLKVEIEI